MTADTATVRLSLAANVRAEMARRGLRCQHFADALELSYRAALDRLNGKSPMPLEDVYATAQWLGCSVGVLLPGQSNVPSGGGCAS